jgi:signal transduction histidine kinase
MGCDARHWISRWAVLGEAWGKPGPWADRLAAISSRLATLESLQGEFAHALESAKLEAMKELAYGAGHEINNPLANISARAQTLLQDETDPERRRTLAAINTQAFRAHEMIADMMLFARPPQPQRETCDLASILRKLVEELAPQAADQQTRFDLRLSEQSITLSADATQLAVAVRSLLVNSLEALVTGGQVEIVLTAPSLADPWVRIAVSDNGPGIPAEMRPKIFDPYFSGREAGRGLGLGLSKCWRIVTLHGGRIEVTDRKVPVENDGRTGSGVRFTISLPASEGN